MANLRDRIGPTIGGEGGKFPYKAPEQYCPKKYEVYNPDIFALGVMIYMVFKGKHPNGLENKKVLNKATSEKEFKSWILTKDKDIEPLINTKLQDYIDGMLKIDPAERPNLDIFYSFILDELRNEDLGVYTQLVGFFEYIDTFDANGDRIDRLYRLHKVANLPGYETKVFKELYQELNAIKLNLINIEDVVYYSELLKFLNRFFKKGYLPQNLLKEEYLDNVRIWYKWYNEMKISDCYKFKVEYRGKAIIDITKGMKKYEAANEYISLSIQYLLELDTEKEVENFFKEFNNNVFFFFFYYNMALNYHQIDIYKTLDFLTKAKETHPTESLFYCKEGKWIEQFLMLWEHNILPVPYELNKSQKEELTAKMKVAFEHCGKIKKT